MVVEMDVGRSVDHAGTPAQSPNSVRAERFGGPVLDENAEFASSGFLVRKCELRDAGGKRATVRGNDVRFRDGSKLTFEVFKTGVRPRHGRTVLVDGAGSVRASAEWDSGDHYFQVHGGDRTYTVDRAEERHRWQIHGDGVVAAFDRRLVEVTDAVPVVALLLAWRIATMLEHMPGGGNQRAKAWNRPDEILGS